MKSKLFVTGIGTDVGKTITSAIICESLKADYWKPIQAGDIDHGDCSTIENLISNSISQFHPNSYALKTPASPHYSAQLDGIEIDLNKLIPPQTNNTLVIEGAGGLLVPLNQESTILDLIENQTDKDTHVIVVSKHYLGSINHTLMTLEMLKQKQLKYSIIFNGDENKATEEIIQKMIPSDIIGRINNESVIDSSVIKKYANHFYPELSKL